MLKELLKEIKKEELGSIAVSPDSEFEGVAIAKVERANGRQGYVLVERTEKGTGIKWDAQCFSGQIERLVEVYLYEEPKKKTSDGRGVDRLPIKEVEASLIEYGMTQEEIDKLSSKEVKRELLRKFLGGEIS